MCPSFVTTGRLTDDKSFGVSSVALQANTVAACTTGVEHSRIVNTDVDLTALDLIEIVGLGLGLCDIVDISVSGIGNLRTAVVQHFIISPWEYFAIMDKR